jgi:hypothetical protein
VTGGSRSRGVVEGAEDDLDAGAIVRDIVGAEDGARLGMDCSFRGPRISTVH